MLILLFSAMTDTLEFNFILLATIVGVAAMCIGAFTLVHHRHPILRVRTSGPRNRPTEPKANSAGLWENLGGPRIGDLG